MNRRDFLLLRSDPARTSELSCQQLYMRYVDAHRVSADQAAADSTYGDVWVGEPPAMFEERTAGQVFDELAADLQSVEVLRVLDSSWLIGDDLKQRFEGLLATFRSAGGRVEYS